MYSEDYEEKEKRGFPLKDFLLKLILIIIFVLLLMWLIPWPNNNVLTDRIFNANIQEMKDASLLYFTKDRLPVNVGDKKTISLQEMLDLKLLLPFADKNGKSCDVERSYVTIEKLDDEYLLKVYLKCDSNEDYILVHVGCYAYCTNDVCEKKEDPKSTATPKPTATAKPTSNPTVKPTTNPTPTNNPVSSQPYCNLKVTDGVIDSSDGKYITNVTIGWASKGSTNGATINGYGLGYSLNYKEANTFVVSNNGTTTVYGYVRDTNGKTASCSISVTKKQKDVPPETKYEYQYIKNYSKEYSAWTPWSKELIYTDKDNIKFGNYELIEAQPTETKYQVIGYRPVTVTYTISKPVQVGSYVQKTCTGYSYTKIDNVEYQVVKDWYATDQYAYENAPSNTSTTWWKFEGFRWKECASECVSHPEAIWRLYKREIKKVTSTTSINGVTCSSVQETTIPLYATQVTKETQTGKVDVYGYVKYYHYRTRTLIKDAYTDEKWSDSISDQSLIAQGYVSTGVKRVKG